MKPAHLLALYKLAEMGAHDRKMECRTQDVAVGIGASQQTASRRLIEMEKAGLIQRTWQGRNQTVQITGTGLQQLAGMHRVLKNVFGESNHELVMSGVVF